MPNGRFEAFSDEVIVIIVTITVLELKARRRRVRVGAVTAGVSRYVWSFGYVGIYWNNDHQMLHACTSATGAMLWVNLPFCSGSYVFPFATGWMGENHYGVVPCD